MGDGANALWCNQSPQPNLVHRSPNPVSPGRPFAYLRAKALMVRAGHGLYRVRRLRVDALRPQGLLRRYENQESAARTESVSPFGQTAMAAIYLDPGTDSPRGGNK
jgi:hypothetical protein